MFMHLSVPTVRLIHFEVFITMYNLSFIKILPYFSSFKDKAILNGRSSFVSKTKYAKMEPQNLPTIELLKRLIMLLTKDRICNIATFGSVILSLFGAGQAKSVLLIVGSITLVPYICSRFNKVTYSAEGVFTNDKGEDLSNRLPKKLGMILCITLIAISATFTSLPSFLPHRFIIPSFAMLIFTIPFLYFMVINCPISILCNKNAYQKEVSGITPSSNAFSKSSDSSSFYNNPGYSNMIGNKYYNSLSDRNR